MIENPKASIATAFSYIYASSSSSITSSTHTQIDRSFQDYCNKHQVKYDHQTAWKDALGGKALLQKIYNDEKVEPSKENLRKIAWEMMNRAIKQGNGYKSGSLVVSDPNYRLFKAITSCSDAYARASSHFRTRAISIPKGNPLAGHAHIGIDIDDLPPNKRTMLVGMIQTKTGEEKIYIKLEVWGADTKITSWTKAWHFFNHCLEFIKSQFRRKMGTNQTDNDRKEHMLPDDKRRIRGLIERGNLFPNDPAADLKEWGFNEAVPYLKKALKQPGIEQNISMGIREYLDELETRYGKSLSTRKGNEVQLNNQDFVSHRIFKAISGLFSTGR